MAVTTVSTLLQLARRHFASRPAIACGDSRWSELHFEVHLNGVPLGEGLTPQDAGALYREFLRREVPQ